MSIFSRCVNVLPEHAVFANATIYNKVTICNIDQNSIKKKGQFETTNQKFMRNYNRFFFFNKFTTYIPNKISAQEFPYNLQNNTTGNIK